MGRGRSVGLIGVLALVLTACGAAAGTGPEQNTVAFIPGYTASGTPSPGVVPVSFVPSRTVTVALGETDPTHMYIHLSQATVPEGKVSFVVTNEGDHTHEFVVLSTKTPAADFPIVSFEGEANRIDEDAPGVTNVGETGDMEPGTSKLLTIDLSSGHYAVVCNLPGHYAAGMHQDFWVT
ncbi:MAG TPA: sulfocyanin-like copper-binding protein [Actinomycetota bacterium]